ncbi:MAG: hypothetical protein KAX09_06470 [Candidatus Heimdallarchaeota archaeon]|nr:hypothetical protein [Candidatus Heimdallarchaeota archaeon]MCK4290611.1 hypothetical protein [Candidatus Heimdallarchaeota archaeon]
MLQRVSRFFRFGFLISLFIVVLPENSISWYAEITENPQLSTNPSFSTHQWLAIEALTSFPDAQIQWITNNLLSFWHGVEAALNDEASIPYGLTSNDYGDINSYVLYLDALGTSVTNDSLALRAEEEYNNLVFELKKTNANYTIASFYAGALSHYVSQAGVWGAIWDETLWGTLGQENWTNFELAIENGNNIGSFPLIEINFRFLNFSNMKNNYFNPSPMKVGSVDGYNATVNLAKNIHPFAQGLGDNFNGSILHADQWTSSYYNDAEACLEYSIEAIYSSIETAIIEANLQYISLPDPSFTFFDSDGQLEIPEFEATFSDNSSTYILAEENTTKAEFYYLYYDQSSLIISMSDENNQFEYNNISKKWFYPKSLTKGLAYNATHSVIYCFQTTKSSYIWSNLTLDTFHLNFFNMSFPDFHYEYVQETFSVNITDANPILENNPGYEIVNDSNVNLAEWILYYGARDGLYPNYIFGVPVIDTEGNPVQGQLKYDNQTKTWSATNVDIGWVYTGTIIDCFVVIKFNLSNLPVGTERETPYSIYYYNYARHHGDYLFKTRSHILTSTKPLIHYFEKSNTLGVTAITAEQDYQNISLDYHQIFEKDIFGNDQRQAKWQLFYFDGAETFYTGDLEWDNNTNTWFVEEFDVSPLGGHEYYFRCRFRTMNSEPNTVFWGPISDLVQIKMGFSSNNFYIMLIIVPIAAFFIYRYMKKNRL